jgi:hypothetical protein
MEISIFNIEDICFKCACEEIYFYSVFLMMQSSENVKCNTEQTPRKNVQEYTIETIRVKTRSIVYGPPFPGSIIQFLLSSDASIAIVHHLPSSSIHHSLSGTLPKAMNRSFAVSDSLHDK